MRDELETIAALRREAEEDRQRLKDLEHLRTDFLEALDEERKRAAEETERARVQFLKAKHLLGQIEANGRRISRLCTGGDQDESLEELADHAADLMVKAAEHLSKLSEGNINLYRLNRFIRDEIVPADLD